MKDWAIITGGGGDGIGAQLALLLAKKQIHVLVVDLNTEFLDAVAKEENLQEYVKSMRGDVTLLATIDRMLDFIPLEDHIRYLVPAQRVGNIGKLENLAVERFEMSMKVHVTSPFMLAKAFLPRMKTTGKARILLTDTLVDYYPAYGEGAYGISKAAYYKLGQQLRLELVDSCVRVGSAYPGLVSSAGQKEDLAALQGGNLLSEDTKMLIEKNKRDGTFLETKVSATFLRYVLLDLADEDFEGKDWKANDKTDWLKWNI